MMTSCVAAATLLVASGLVITLARRRFVVVTVVGASMEPTLRPGDQVLVRRQGSDKLGVGVLVVFQEPGGHHRSRTPASGIARRSWAIKRIAAVPGSAVPDSVRSAAGGADIVPPGMLVVLGDGTRSGDSRQWGFIPADQVLGFVVRKLTSVRSSRACFKSELSGQKRS
jgi:signal peptidase I